MQIVLNLSEVFPFLLDLLAEPVPAEIEPDVVQINHEYNQEVFLLYAKMLKHITKEEN